jgi:hypothetical protein
LCGVNIRITSHLHWVVNCCPHSKSAAPNTQVSTMPQVQDTLSCYNNNAIIQASGCRQTAACLSGCSMFSVQSMAVHSKRGATDLRLSTFPPMEAVGGMEFAGMAMAGATPIFPMWRLAGARHLPRTEVSRTTCAHKRDFCMF